MQTRRRLARLQYSSLIACRTMAEINSSCDNDALDTLFLPERMIE